ncbi:hypothetical protein GPALN_007904 [Globodera pallida]|nr:hypothetical protein GPALN_007904 [Globodera pallida]
MDRDGMEFTWLAPDQKTRDGEEEIRQALKAAKAKRPDDGCLPALPPFDCHGGEARDKVSNQPATTNTSSRADSRLEKATDADEWA